MVQTPGPKMKDDERLTEAEQRILYGSPEERARDASPVFTIVMLAIVGIVAAVLISDWLDPETSYDYSGLVRALFRALIKVP